MTDDYIHVIKDLPEHDTPAGKMRVLSGEQGAIFWITTEPGAQTPLHSHPIEQATWLVSGAMDVQVADGKRRRVEPGTVLLVPAGVPHQLWAIDACTLVEFTAPPRTDWQQGPGGSAGTEAAGHGTAD